ncbi:dephospho-CoA kinase [Streptomyces sp. WMMC500]|uniref:dephospho-CoA kinase n=1 Tax=Streptomyces sp. WMMC500 TaxID=3015154 RepID=UPI00248B3BFA|nr:dephospho-CoA kinase [Streptomyces sp. WMMC500]WBB60016.1 dephospho-CoA kinase [Streptomyces sp. WMMC500]
MLTVGLTGGIGAGKSAVARALASYGAVIVDSDEIAREVVEPGTPGLAAVVAEFGAEVLTADGSLDRARLGGIVFADAGRRQALNGIVHPLVRDRSAALQEAAGPDAIVVNDVPLLAENDLAGLYDVVVVVDAAPATQLDRLVRLRGMAPDEARARMAAQATREQRLAIADIVVDNDGTPEELAERVRKVWEELVARKGVRGRNGGA